MDYLLLIIADILLAGSFVFTKLYQKEEGVSLRKGFIFGALTGLFSAVLSLAFQGFQFQITWFSAVIAIGTSLLWCGYTLLGFRVMSMGKMALYTVFLMTGGMIVPYIWGLLFLDEPFSWLRSLGLLVIGAAVLITNADQGKVSLKQILMCLSIFLLNGFLSVLSKEHQISSMAVPALPFVTLSGFGKLLISAAALLFMRNTPAEPVRVGKKSLLFVLAVAACSGVSYLLQLLGAVNLPATVLYPVVTGGSIFFTSLAGTIVFREKLTRQILIGILLCVLGTCLFL